MSQQKISLSRCGRRAAARGSGFTLVELLVAITIMSLLATISAFTVFRALLKARVNGMAAEVAQLETAMQKYSSEHGQRYPPDMGARAGVAGVKDRALRIVEHLRYAYPRAYTNGNYTSYSAMRSYIMNNYNVPLSGTTSGGSAQGRKLDLDNLDQAEALVFWLGGFPTPVDANGVPVAGTKLFGFHVDPSQPFRKDTPSGNQPESIWLQYRTKPDFDFDETRLVDIDDDGWWEYIPKGASPGTNGEVAPFVYFDGATYTTMSKLNSPLSFNGYPIASGPGASPGSAGLISGWGLAVPYVSKAPASNPNAQISWVNPNKFQIVCAGIDSNYGEMNMRLPVSPGRACYRGNNFAIAGGMEDSELDNITNFADGKLEDFQ